MGKKGRSGVNSTGRNRKLNKEQEAVLQARHKLYRDNCPKRIAADLGISRQCVDTYVRRALQENAR